MKNYFLILVLSFIVIGCAPKPEVYFDSPYELLYPTKKFDFLNSYAKVLKDKKIFVDPGHGGKSDRGAEGMLKLIQEADVNLRVAKHLKSFIEEAGGKVVISRTEDVGVELGLRSKIANKSGCDVFISIHHNAPADDNDEWINYTSTYFHALQTDYEFEPCEYDLAKFVQRDLAYAVKNSGGPSSFDGTYSDYNIYPKKGFSVLRLTEIPSILVECGFVTNHWQEKKLAIDEFNKIEAWGIFKGLCRYFAQSFPLIEMLENKDSVRLNNSFELFSIKDAAGIKPNSFQVYIDSVKTSKYSYDKEKDLLKVMTNSLAEGEHIIRVIAENKKGNHSFPFHKKIRIVK